MSLVKVSSIASIGLNKDYPPALVPSQAWTHVRNARCYDGALHKSEGESTVLTPAVDPYGLFSINLNGQQFWAIAGLAAAYGWSGGSSAVITRASGAYTATVFNQWNGGVFNGNLLLNNGVDVPQAWTVPGLGTPLVDLPNWPASTTARVVRPFKAFLVALDTTQSSVRYKRRVKWSHSSASGWPSSWDPADPELDSGEYDLPDGDTSLIYCEALGETNVLYTEAETWLMQLTGSSDIFGFRRLFDTSGILAQRCVVPFRKGSGPSMHFVAAQDDVIIHDGVRLQSVMDSALRRWFFANLDTSAYFVTHCVHFRRNAEIWLMFPSVGSGSLCNLALVWNYKDNTWVARDVPQVRFSESSNYGLTYIPEDTWEGLDEQWDTGLDEGWSSVEQSVFNETVLMASIPTSVKQVDPASYQFSGSEITTVLEHEALTIVGAGQDGQPVSDPAVLKHAHEFWPSFDATVGDSFTIEFGSREFLTETVSYPFSGAFVVGTDKFVSPHISGRYINLRITHTGTNNFRFLGYGLDIGPLGEL